MAPDARVENRLQGSSRLSLPPVPDAVSDLSGQTVSSALNALASNGAGAPSIRYSSQFLAQLVAQLPAAANDSLMGQWAAESVPTSILDNRLMEMFGMVKYKPSYAAKPSPQPSGVAALLAASEAASATRQAGTAMQPRMSAASSVIVRAANNNERLRVAGNDNLPSYQPRPEPSLVRPTGMGAYAASTERNTRYLQPVTSQAASEAPVEPVAPVRDNNAA